jgi:hypothetical protein
MTVSKQAIRQATFIVTALLGFAVMRGLRSAGQDPIPKDLRPMLDATSPEKRAVVEQFVEDVRADMKELQRSGRPGMPGSYTEGVAWGQNMSAQGLPRLEDSLIIVHSTLTGRVLASTDPQTCSAIATGTATSQQMYTALLALDAVSIQRWLGIQRRAFNLAVNQQGEAPPTEEVGARAFAALVDRMHPADAERFQAWTEMSAPPAEENCWAMRSIADAAVKLPPQQGATAIRYLYSATPREQQ